MLTAGYLQLLLRVDPLLCFAIQSRAGYLPVETKAANASLRQRAATSNHPPDPEHENRPEERKE
jgi:hypothetical protein